MRIFKHSPLDAWLVAYSVAHGAALLGFALIWDSSAPGARLAMAVGLAALTTYNIIIVSHLFTHKPWFEARAANAAVSILNSITIGQSVQAYRLSHVRNHHRYNNDRAGADGETKDTSSTFSGGRDGEHLPAWRYAFIGAAQTLFGATVELIRLDRLWGLGPNEAGLRENLAAADPARRRELRQLRLDRIARAGAMVGLLLISWPFVLFCLFPALYAAFALVNVQNYFEHFGARPEERRADSVSHYGRLYNRLTFNDGHHQEHHLRPNAHWSRLPEVRRELSCVRDGARVVSPVPAILGFLDRSRTRLDRAPVPPAEGEAHG